MLHNSNGKVFILHCENANPEQHWYLWLEQQLKSEGIAAERIFLADSNHPEAENLANLFRNTTTRFK